MNILRLVLCIIVICVGMFFICYFKYSDDVGLNGIIKAGIFLLMLGGIFGACELSSAKESRRERERYQNWWSRKTGGHEE